MAIINNLCAPSLIYLFYSFSQIFIDLYKKMYNTAFLKFIIMIIFTFLLNMLCAQGLGVISWILVFIPFMLMSLITAILLYVFGLDPSSGKVASLRTKNNSSTSTPVSGSAPSGVNVTTSQTDTPSSSGSASRSGTNDVIGNTFNSVQTSFDNLV
jgi:hypothetical protein